MRRSVDCQIPCPVSVPTAASLDRQEPRIRGGRPQTTPYVGSTLLRRRQPCGVARIVAPGRLASESAGRTYILVYRAMAKLYRP
jgi:hypothetical protein